MTAEPFGGPVPLFRQYLVFSIDYRGRQNDGTLGAAVSMVTGYEHESAEQFAERWYEDPAILRVYELTEVPRPDTPKER